MAEKKSPRSGAEAGQRAARETAVAQQRAAAAAAVASTQKDEQEPADVGRMGATGPGSGRLDEVEPGGRTIGQDGYEQDAFGRKLSDKPAMAPRDSAGIEREGMEDETDPKVIKDQQERANAAALAPPAGALLPGSPAYIDALKEARSGDKPRAKRGGGGKPAPGQNISEGQEERTGQADIGAGSFAPKGED